MKWGIDLRIGYPQWLHIIHRVPEGKEGLLWFCKKSFWFNNTVTVCFNMLCWCFTSKVSSSVEELIPSEIILVMTSPFSILTKNDNLSVSFCGSGFLATYQLGAAQSLLDNAAWILQGAPRVYGASAGSLVAAAVVCGSNLGNLRTFYS